MRRSLADDAWTVEAVEGSGPVPPAVRGRVLPARVPGCVHRDLERAGLVPDFDRGDGEDACAWIGLVDWSTRCRFDADIPGDGRLDLVCDGLDTVVTVALNGVRLGAAANMHHPHRFDARSAIRSGRNELVLTFRGPLAWIREEAARLGSRPVNGDWDPYVYARKAACHFGWDWGPRVPTAGAWRDVALEAWSTARIAAVRPLVREATADRAVLDIACDVERDPGDASPLVLACTVTRPDGRILTRTAPYDPVAPVRFEIDRPHRWWPRGHGAQPLHGVGVVLRTGDRVLDVRALRTGLRTVRLDTGADDDGSACAVEVNGRPVFCAGANWIPASPFPSEPAPARRRALVDAAVAANVNMLRVWGGGTYEDDAFYDACDAAGVLVWQDFMFACATYPEDDPYPALVEAEARHAVARLCRHPSVVLWCGGNENVWAWSGWGFREKLRPGQAWGRRYWLDLLPAVVAALDPTRPYRPDSPWSGALDAPANDADRGDCHLWDESVEGYRTVVPRFLSEFGHQSPPSAATLARALPAWPTGPDDPALRRRQRAAGGDAVRYAEPLTARFAPPATFDDWHYLAQLLQARAVALGIAWARANMPRCMGALFWQWNDTWAGHSWSAIDVDGRRKPLWFAARRAFAPRVLSVHPEGGAPVLHAVNDTDDAWATPVRLRRLRFDGTAVATDALDLAVPPRSATSVADLAARLGRPDDPGRELLVATPADGTERVTWFFRRDRALAYPPPAVTVDVVRDDTDVRLVLGAATLVRDLVLAVDRLDSRAEVDDQLLTLLPGESRTLRVTGADGLDPAALARPPVLNCANRFGARRG